MRKLWGGHYDEPTDALIERLNNSLRFDARLWRHDIQGSIAHAAMLGTVGIIPLAEADQLVSGLTALEADLAAGSVELPADAEDVHHFVEKALVEELGALGWKLHTGRSRNELVATDFRLFVMAAAGEVQHGIEALLNSFLLQAKANLSETLGFDPWALAAVSADDSGCG